MRFAAYICASIISSLLLMGCGNPIGGEAQLALTKLCLDHGMKAHLLIGGFNDAVTGVECRP